jgi:hypothetical protein
VFGAGVHGAEQALGRIVDGRADLRGQGDAVRDAAGRLPFRDPDPIVMMQMHKAEPPSLRRAVHDAAWCTPELVALVDAALVKNPDHRFASARAMIEMLDGAFASLE